MFQSGLSDSPPMEIATFLHGLQEPENSTSNLFALLLYLLTTFPLLYDFYIH